MGNHGLLGTSIPSYCITLGLGHTPVYTFPSSSLLFLQSHCIERLPRENSQGQSSCHQNSEKRNLYPGTCPHQQLISLTALRRSCLQDAIPTPLPLPASSPGHPPVTHYTFRSKKTLKPKPLLVFPSYQIFKAVCTQEKSRKISLVLHIQEASTALIAGTC